MFELGEHFGFTALMGIVLLGAFTTISLVPLIGARFQADDDEGEEE